MKKQIIVALALSVSLYTLAQKKELKAFERAINKQNYKEAKVILTSLNGLTSSMDSKQLDKFYTFKGTFLIEEAAKLDDDTKILEALKVFDKLSPGGQKKVQYIKDELYNSSLTESNDLYTKGKFSEAAYGFSMTYELSKDEELLYYASQSALQAKDYDSALNYLTKLKELNYTGETMQYFAVDKLTGKKVLFDKKTRDRVVKVGTHLKPTQEMSKSKEAEIVKSIALIYIQKGENDKALAAIKDARDKNQDDANLIVSEANIYLALKQNDKATVLFKEAISKDPTNVDLIYNVGVLAMNENQNEEAKEYFLKALNLDPSYTFAAQNLSTLKINEGNALNDKMNALGTSSSDFKKYDEYKAIKQGLFIEGAKVLEEFVSKNPNTKNLDLLTQLKNIYNAIGESSKAKAIKAKIAALQAK